MATIDDVAALAGVSVATVSRVMNNSYVVSEDKRKRVLLAAQTLNYQPATYNRSQKKTESKTLLMICSVVINEVMAGIQAMARELGYDVLIHYNSDRNTDLNSVKILKNKMVDGVILLNMLLDNSMLESISSQFPVVQCGDYVDLPKSYQVSVDNEGGAYAMTSHLIETRRRRIAFIMPNIEADLPYFALLRWRGYRRALEDHGLSYDPQLVIKADFSLESGYEAGRQILSMQNRPDGVFCAIDQLAIGCVHVFRDNGLVIPRDIAVAGFDDDEAAEICSPPLTTVAQPHFEIGRDTVRLLSAVINGEISVGRKICINYDLKIRASTVGSQKQGHRTATEKSQANLTQSGGGALADSRAD